MFETLLNSESYKESLEKINDSSIKEHLKTEFDGPVIHSKEILYNFNRTYNKPLDQLARFKLFFQLRN